MKLIDRAFRELFSTELKRVFLKDRKEMESEILTEIFERLPKGDKRDRQKKSYRVPEKCEEEAADIPFQREKTHQLPE